MNRRPGTLRCLLAAMLLASTVHALPNPDEPIDPTKRARISTRDATRPSASPVRGDGVVGRAKVRTATIAPVRAGARDTRRLAGVDVRETRAKSVTKPRAPGLTARARGRIQNPGDLPASVPRLAPDRYRRMLAHYREGRVPATDLRSGSIQVGNETLDMAALNRYAGPRAALESQGIPVAAAGSAPAPENASSPVAVPEAKNPPASAK